MDIGHITQLAKDLLGKSKCVYRQDLTRPPGEAHLKVDELGAGDFFFVDSGIPNSNPSHSYGADGLLLSIERPLGTSGNMGEFGAANTQSVTVPDRFLLVATFKQPSQVSLTAAPPSGTYAPAILINADKLMGASCQFRPEGVRLNLPMTGIMANRPPIAQNFVDRILDQQHPSPLSLALQVSRTAAAGTGKAFLFIGDDEADSIAFDFPNFTTSIKISDLRAGIGTANGAEYRVSVRLLDFEIWAPTQ
jgi:hypothetical protein